MKTRTEHDSLGERDVPEDAYYGIQTLRAIENFPVSGIMARPEFINAMAMVKKAAAMANMDVGWLEPYVAEAIIAACDEILSGKLHDQFVVDDFQAGAGTSFNMNMNEVIANRALELLGKKKGEYAVVQPQRPRQHGAVDERHLPDRHAPLHPHHRPAAPGQPRRPPEGLREEGDGVRAGSSSPAGRT